MSAKIENEDCLDDVSIPGLKIILSPKRSIWIRIVWALAIVFGIGLFCIQISERIDFFINHSTGMKIVESDEIVPVLPKISICNSPETLYDKNNYRIKGFSQNIPTWLCKLKHQSIEDSFKKLRIPFDDVDLIGKDNRNKWRKVTFAYQRWNSQIGSCITITPDIETPVRNLHLSIKDSWYTPNPAINISYFRFYIHEEKIPFTPEWIIKHSALQSKEPLIAMIDSSKFSYLNSSKKPCVSKDYYEQCRRSCLERAYNLTHCELPYMTSTNNNIAPKCLNQDQCASSVQQAHKIYIEFTPQKCNCGTKCEWFLYNVQLGRALSNRYNNDVLPTAHLELQFETFTLIEEYVAYNFISLLSDIGGCLGLTLGLSILGLVETIAGLIKWARHIKIKTLKSKLVAKLIPKHGKREFDTKSIHKNTGSHRWIHRARNILKKGCCCNKRRPKYMVEENELPEVSIPGMPVIYTEHNMTRKIFWLVAVSLCLVLSIMQINRHVQYLHNNSTAIRISVNAGEDVKLPIITFCPAARGSDLKYNVLFKHYKFFEKCAKLGYNQTDNICDFLHISNTKYEYILGMYTADSIRTAENNLHYNIPLRMGGWGFGKTQGFCIATKLKVKFSQNQFFYDVTALVPHRLWRAPGNPELFHMFLSDNLAFGNFEIFQHAIPIKMNAENYVTVQFTKFSYLNRPQSPCHDSDSLVNHYRHVCVGEATEKNMPCNCSKGLHACESAETCNCHLNHGVFTMRKFSWEKCEKQFQFRTCEGTVYKLSQYSTPGTDSGVTVIKFHFQDLATKYVEEYVTYTFTSLLCDAGAIFGVMMGACILTFLQLIELAVHGLKSLFKRKMSELKTKTIFVKRH